MVEKQMERATFSGLCRIMEGRGPGLRRAVARQVKAWVLFGAGLLGPEAAVLVSAVNAAKDAELLDQGIGKVLDMFRKDQDSAWEKSRAAHVMMVFSAYFDAFRKGRPEDYKGIELEAEEKGNAALSALEAMEPDRELTDFDLALNFETEGLPDSFGQLRRFYGLLTDKLTSFIEGLRYIETLSGGERDELYAFLRALPERAVEEFRGQYHELSAKYQEFFVYSVHSKLDGISRLQKESNRNQRAILERLEHPTATGKYRLDRGWSGPEYFVPGSRDRELEACERLLAERGQVYLHGLGGIGKTETAIQLAMRLGNCYLVHYKGNMENTIRSMAFSGYRYTPTPGADVRQEDLDRRLDILKEEYAGAVLIVDNFDDGDRSLDELRSEETFRRLCGLGIRLVLTTRCDASGEGVEIRPLTDEDLRALMTYHLRGMPLSREEMEELIQAAGRHTLLLTLIAKTLYESEGDVTARDILDALKKGTLSEQDFPKVATDQNRSREQLQLFVHLAALFDVSKLGDLGRRVMACAALLPEGGMEQSTLRACLTGEEKETLRSLRGRGWLGNGENRYTIHPAVREVCIGVLKPSREVCGDFLVKLYQQLDPRNYDKEKYRQLADVFANASRLLKEWRGNYANWAGYLYGELGDHPAALEQDLLALERCQRAFGEEHHLTATGYNNVGGTYGDLGEHPKALEYQKKALAIWEKVLPKDHPDLAVSYNNVGFTYGALGNHPKALEYLQKALTIREKVLPKDHPDLAQSYNNVGSTYGALGNHPKALEYQKKALAIWEKALPEDHPNLAASYNNVGLTYGDLGDHQKALKYQEKALTIREKKLPEDHPDLAQSYNNVGSAYGALGDHQKALEYKEKALAIREKVLPEDHPNLALSYNNVGSTYGDLGDHQKALEYQKKALAIREKVLPEDHLDLATSCHNVSLTCYVLKDYDQALEFLQKAVAIREKKLPGGHPDLLDSYLGLAVVYGAKGDMEQAFYWFVKSQPPGA